MFRKLILLIPSYEGIPNKRIWLQHFIEQLVCIGHETETCTAGYEVSDGVIAVVKASAKEV